MTKTDITTSVMPCQPLSLSLIGGILLILFSIIGCSDSPHLGSMLTVDDVDQYFTSTEDSICLLNGADPFCITLIPEPTVDENGVYGPIIQVNPTRFIYVLYREGVPVLQAKRATGTGDDADGGDGVGVRGGGVRDRGGDTGTPDDDDGTPKVDPPGGGGGGGGTPKSDPPGTDGTDGNGGNGGNGVGGGGGTPRSDTPGTNGGNGGGGSGGNGGGSNGDNGDNTPQTPQTPQTPDNDGNGNNGDDNNGNGSSCDGNWVVYVHAVGTNEWQSGGICGNYVKINHPTNGDITFTGADRVADPGDSYRVYLAIETGLTYNEMVKRAPEILREYYEANHPDYNN